MKALKILALMSILTVTQGFAGIAGSKHDLSATSALTGIGAIAGGVDEICVFCHTPHGANTSFTGAPIWNKENAQVVTWTMYGTTSAATDITTESGGTPSDSSKACLSCHDGVSAVNSLQNAPGSGIGGTASGMTGQYADMTLKNGTTAATTGAQSIIDLGGDTAVNIGDASGAETAGSLSNDHPISVTYNSANASLKDPAALDSFTGWTTPTGVQSINAILRGGKVECATCHDPHLGPVAGTQELFLRSGTNAKSKLCLGCHAK